LIINIIVNINNCFLRKFQCIKMAYFLAQEAACRVTVDLTVLIINIIVNINNCFLRKFQCIKIAYFLAQEAACRVTVDLTFLINKR